MSAAKNTNYIPSVIAQLQIGCQRR